VLGKLAVWEIAVGEIVTGEIAVGQIVTGESALGKLRWGNDLTPIFIAIFLFFDLSI